MGITVVSTTVPVANDVLQGECKAYANYNTPKQTLLGASDGGVEIDVEREIKILQFDGAYGHTLDSDGLPLVRYMKLNGKVTLNQLYLKYFHSKKISDCESDGAWENNNWGGDGGTYAAETSIVNTENQSAKCSIASAQTGHGIHEVFTASKDLTVFDNSETSDTGDYIGFSIYITTAMLAILGTDSIQIRLHMDIEGTETNYYWYDIEATALTADQWNNLKILKSSFTAQGSGDWSAVTGISFEVPDETDDALEFYVDSIDLIQAQTNSSFVPLNAGGFDYTDETTYRKITPDIEITEDDYLENITIIGQKLDGKKWKVVIKNALNDGEINLAFQEFKEVINGTVFTGHYDATKGTTPPIEIYEYVA
jgi:hypothetical protein